MLQITGDMMFTGMMTIFLIMGISATIGIIYEFVKKRGRKGTQISSTDASEYTICTFCGHRNPMYMTTCEKCGADT